MLLPSEPELPPKNVATLNALTTKRLLLRGELASHCISDYLGCYDLPRAKDFLRTYACSFYDLLKEAYSHKIATWDCEDLIAKEAIQITLACWEGFGAGPNAEAWIDTLHKAIVLHVGHSLRGHAGVVRDNPPLNVTQAARYAAAGVDTDSPLVKDAIAARSKAQPTANPLGIKDELRRLLDESRLRPEDIAEEIGIEPRNVYRHLSGDTVPSLVNVGKYEKALSEHLGRNVRLPTPEKRQNVSKTSATRQ